MHKKKHKHDFCVHASIDVCMRIEAIKYWNIYTVIYLFKEKKYVEMDDPSNAHARKTRRYNLLCFMYR